MENVRIIIREKKILYRLLKSYKKKKMRKKLETDDFIKSKFNNNFVSDMSWKVDEIIIKIDVYEIIKK